VQIKGAQVLARGTPLPAFDLHCPLMSLPLAFNTTLATIPSPQGYLRADPALAAAWGARLGEAKVPRIGLVWSGNAAHRNDGNRSMALATLLAALPEEVTQGLNPLAQLYVLQKDMSAPDAATLAAHPGVIHLPQALANFDDTAALLSHMDVVISVDTSIAHLAGAMGKPVWVLLSMLQDWRWLLERSDSPWYASARLFRQHSAGQWREPLLAMAQALPAELAQWQTRRTRH